jgi:hypothetical protein
MNPTVRGIAGSGTLFSAANTPSASNRAFRASNSRCKRPTPSSTIVRTLN